jgi:prolyl oligopeptidase
MKHPRACRQLRANSLRASAIAVLLAAPLGAQLPSALDYPAAPRGTQTDDLGGVRVADPYRWLESITSPDVRAWVAAQNTLTQTYLGRAPRHREVVDRVRRWWDSPRVSTPFSGAEHLFFYENSGLQSQPALYMKERRETPPRMLIDPSAFTHDGSIAIVDQAASPDGRYLAYAVSTQGSSWRTVMVRDLRTGQDGPEQLTGIKESGICWTKDGRGFFYVRSDFGRPVSSSNPLTPDGRQRLYYHRIGQRQAEDRLVFESPDHPDWRFRVNVSEDGQYLVIGAGSGVELQNRLFLIDLDNPKRPNLEAPLVKLFDTNDALYEFVSSQGPVFFIRTTKNAPRARLVAVDINSPDESHWSTVAKQTYDPLIGAVRVDDRFVVHRLHDAHSVLELYAFDGGARGTITLPGIGTVTELNAQGDYRELYFTYTSFLQPATTYRYDLDTKSAAPFKETRFDDTTLVAYETTQLFFTSKDGTRVPMFITARRGITLDGTHATWLSGDGALGDAGTPEFSPAVAAWLEMGGIYAVANARGGGEYGRAWHEAARRGRKQTSVDDFLAAAQFLVDQRYTRPSLLAIGGRGHGGLLVGAAMTQRPDLFAAVLVDAGLLDMTRFARFGSGASWTREYGSPEDATNIHTLLAYSPVHNVRAGTRYPATLITVGERDEVVAPIHSYKFAAALQASQSGEAPVLLRVEPDAGFGPGTPVGKEVAMDADRLTFLVNALHAGR